MSALLDQAVKTFIRHADEADIGPVLREMMMKHIDELPDFEAFLRVLNQNGGDLSLILGRTHEPVSVDEFIDSDYFLNMADHVWPEQRRVIKDVIEGGYIEFLAMGAIGIGKTTAAQIVTAIHLYHLSCEKFPQLRYKLMPTSSIVIACMNINDTNALKVTFGELRQMLEPVPYFAEHFPFPTDVKSAMNFPRNINILPSAATASKVLGMNVIGGIIDELDFMQIIQKSKQTSDGSEFNQAKTIYGKVVKRRKSRFLRQGKMPGCLCIVSSKGAPGSFTEVRKQEVEQENDGLTYVWERTQWDATPAERWEGQGRFTLEVGDERYSSRVVPEGEKAREGARTMQVPMSLRTDFLSDMEGSLRDFAGIATMSKRPYFSSREKIWQMADLHKKAGMSNAFAVHEFDFMESGEPELPPFNPDFKPQHLDRPRVVHIDLGLTSDRCGIAVGYVVKTSFMRVNSRADQDDFTVEEVPTIAYDGVITIKPPMGGEIDFSMVRSVLYHLRDDMGIPISRVSLDGFQSADMKQILRKRRFRTLYESVDGKESVPVYQGFRAAIFHGRVLAPEHGIAFNELASLEHDKKTNVIDHPVHGSKDTADAMAGVFKQLMAMRGNWRSEEIVDVIGPLTKDKMTEAKVIQKVAERRDRRPDPPRPQGRAFTASARR